MAPRVVAYEPSPEYREVVGCLIEQADRYDLVSCETAEEFSRAIAQSTPGLVLLSFADLPGGEDRLADLRRTLDAPIMAFVQNAEESKAALRSGADYDLPKPFDPEVFLIAVEAVMRRSVERLEAGQQRAELALEDGLKIYPERRTVERDGRRQTLSQTEWQLFSFLMANPAKVMSRRELAAGAWGPGFASRGGQAELYVSRVRRRVECDARHPRIIETVRGRGYRFAAHMVPAAVPQRRRASSR
jgi:two-component system KDP operon response regulator KdpE